MTAPRNRPALGLQKPFYTGPWCSQAAATAARPFRRAPLKSSPGSSWMAWGLQSEPSLRAGLGAYDPVQPVQRARSSSSQSRVLQVEVGGVIGRVGERVYPVAHDWPGLKGVILLRGKLALASRVRGELCYRPVCMPSGRAPGGGCRNEASPAAPATAVQWQVVVHPVPKACPRHRRHVHPNTQRASPVGRNRYLQQGVSRDVKSVAAAASAPLVGHPEEDVCNPGFPGFPRAGFRPLNP